MSADMFKSKGHVPSVLMIMICMRCTLGGAEKRYARVFEMLVAQSGDRHRLLINRSMLTLLQSADILSHHEPYLIVLDSPFRRWGQSLATHTAGRRVSRLFISVLEGLDALWFAWRCWQVVSRNRPEVVHPLLTGVYLSFPALLAHPNVRYTLSAYSYQFESYRDKRFLGISLGATIKRFAMRRCHMIDALSEPIRGDLVSRGIHGDKIRVAPCSFTDLSLCQPADRKKKWVVFLGRFVDIKNPLLLAQAIPKILAQVQDVHFYFLGEGYLRSRLESIARERDIADHVTIRFDPHPTRILNQSSIFVSLQNEENYPSQSLLEAMACGNAIVATDAGETWRLVDEVNGIRIPPTVDDLADAIVKLLQDPSLLQRGLASRQRVISDHTAARFFGYISGVYRAAVQADEPG